ncbi:MAG: hypothetical protein WCK02_13630 [Bacteroidota bacterium]
MKKIMKTSTTLFIAMFFCMITSSFAQNPIKDTSIMVANISSGEISYDLFFNNDLDINIAGLAIESFAFEFTNKEGKLTTFRGEGNLLNDEMKFAIRVIIKDGGILTFKNIVAKDSNGKKYSVKPSVYQLKKKI